MIWRRAGHDNQANGRPSQVGSDNNRGARRRVQPTAGQRPQQSHLSREHRARAQSRSRLSALELGPPEAEMRPVQPARGRSVWRDTWTLVCSLTIKPKTMLNGIVSRVGHHRAWQPSGAALQLSRLAGGPVQVHLQSRLACAPQRTAQEPANLAQRSPVCRQAYLAPD